VPEFTLKRVSPTPFFDDDEVGEDIKDQIKEWFYENFEEPAEHMPRGDDGKYQWIWGGPFEAGEEIQDHFSEVDDELLDDVIGELEREAPEWAPHVDRVIDEDEVARCHAEMQAAITALQLAMAEFKPFSRDIGGNHPPEHIGLPPYDETDEKQIAEAIERLSGSASDLSANPRSVATSAETLKGKGERIKEFTARHGDKFVSSFADQLGKRAADSLTLAGWIKFGGLLLAVYEAAQAFFAASKIPWPF
jgi:hypothetical protein